MRRSTVSFPDSEFIKIQLADQKMRKTGLTRTEVLVIIVILAMGFALFFPFVHQQRVRYLRSFCELRQIHTSFALLHHESHVGRFSGYKNLQAIDEDGNRQPTSWVFPALPYLFPSQVQIIYNEQTGEFETTGISELSAGPYTGVQVKYGPDGEFKSRGMPPEFLIKELICPSDRPPRDEPLPISRMSFVVNAGMPDVPATDSIPADWPANGVFMDRFTPSGVRAHSVSIDELNKLDGTNFTLLLTENVDAELWTDTEEAKVGIVWVAKFVDEQPSPGKQLLRINQQIGQGDGSIRFARPSSFHPGGVNAAYCSGRTSFLDDEMDYLVFAQMLSSDDSAVTTPGTHEHVPAPYRPESKPANAD